MNEHDLLTEIYEEALSAYNALQPLPDIDEELSGFCKVIIDHQDSPRGVLAVLTTLLLKKVSDPTQDIRMHQVQLPGGFSGRVLDTKVVTPFLKEQDFPYMASGSGWLTRSLEQAVPYDLNYSGQIRPIKVKNAFLRIIDTVQNDNVVARDVLIHLLVGLIKFRERNANIVLARPINLSVSETVEKIDQHYHYKASGVARLPVLAVHSILSVLVKELNRYQDHFLMPLEQHTASDTRSGLIGDIHIAHSSGTIFEAFEIKHEIPLTKELVSTSFEKFRTMPVERFYILTTHDSGIDQVLYDAIQHVRIAHGCQLILNGVAPTLKYYLRLVSSTSQFVDAYVSAVENDPAVSYALKQAWNEIVGMG